jgi:hypothetical protein
LLRWSSVWRSVQTITLDAGARQSASADDSGLARSGSINASGEEPPHAGYDGLNLAPDNRTAQGLVRPIGSPSNWS